MGAQVAPPVSANMSNTTMQTMSVRGRESCRDQSLQIEATPECPAFIWHMCMENEVVHY